MSYLGFSAETGELSDNFDLISVETNNLYVVNTPVPKEQTVVKNEKKDKKETKKEKKEKKKAEKAAKAESEKKEGSGWGWTLIKILLFFVDKFYFIT